MSKNHFRLILSVFFISAFFLAHGALAATHPTPVFTVDMHDYTYPPEASTDANTGGQVSGLQNFLTTTGYFHGPVSGYFGSVTKTAVVNFQVGNCIDPASGYVGSVTRARIATGNYVNGGPNPTTCVPAPSNPFIQIYSPNGGEHLVSGQTANISWNAHNIPLGATLSLGLIPVGAPCSPLPCVGTMMLITTLHNDSGQYTNSASYDWLVPIMPGPQQYNINIIVRQGNNPETLASDQTDAPFTIGPLTTTGPHISFLSSVSGRAGSQLTIYGSGFAPTYNTVNFIGPPPLGAGLAVLPSNGTSITVTVPNIANLPPGIYMVAVSHDPDNSPSNLMTFVVLSSNQTGSPVISSLSPNPAPVESSVDIIGSGQIISGIFYPVLTDNGCPAVILPIHFSPTTGRPIFDVPFHYGCSNGYHPVVPGNYIVQGLDTNNWKISNAVNFVVNAGTVTTCIPYTTPGVQYTCAPSYSYIDPSFGPVGSTVYLYGSNFNPNTFVALDGSYGQSITPTLISSTTLRFIIPSNTSLGTHLVQVNDRASSFSLSGYGNFTVTSGPAPTPPQKDPITTVKPAPSVTPSTSATPKSNDSANKMQTANVIDSLNNLVNIANGNNMTAEVRSAINLLLRNLQIFGRY